MKGTLTAAILAAAIVLPLRGQHPAQNAGAVGAWQKILKLQTTASVMHTTAHPDDEHGGLLAMLSRGQGAEVSMLTLTRGESGDNAIGPELFDAVGLIRTEELLVANRYYGVDRQYFSTAVDYGFSKRLDEALEKWGREDVIREMVKIIRTERPFVIVSRFQGNARDGHGNHQAAGLLTQQAFEAAANPASFPEQTTGAGLQPWQALKLYMGGVRENEDWTIRVDTGAYDPLLGESYQTFGRLGLSFQRSQTGGRFVPHAGPSIAYYKRLASVVDAPARENGFFDGVDTSVRGLYRALRKAPPAGAESRLESVQRELEAAKASFTFTDPATAVPALTRAWHRLADARAALAADKDVAHVLAAKGRQVEEAIHAALGLTLTAVAQPVGTPESSGPFSAGPPPMAPVVPGGTFDVRVNFVNRSGLTLDAVQLQVEGGVAGGSTASPAPARAAPNAPVAATFTIKVPEDARTMRPAFSRRSLQEARYTVSVPEEAFAPSGEPPFQAQATYSIDGVTLTLRRPVTRLDANLPFGHETRTLAIVPAIALTLAPAHAIVVPEARGVKFTADVLNNREGPAEGTLTLDVPAGWTVSPSMHSFAFARGGERRPFSFVVNAASGPGEHVVTAVARSGGREYREGYTTIRHRDLDTRYLYRAAVGSVRGVDVRVPAGLRVGYVMGIGDEVPAGLAQLGAEVHLLTEQDLATSDLGRFTAIMTGTRAYAVREDLRTHNGRLLEYVRAGGNLIVLYNTQELVPGSYAPYPGELPRNAEEVSEEDSPVEILAPDAPVLTTPNRITKADFDGWVEQRGSKFWTTWDPRYTPMIATWDQGQPPQKGGWLHARYGKGHYTYFAYALHRQLPYGVPGAYRLLANLLALNVE